MKSRALTIVVTLLVCCGFSAAVLLTGEFIRRRGAALEGLEKPDSLTLYAIDGVEDVAAKYATAVTQKEEVFHEYAVLGKVEITGAAELAKIAAAVQRAVVSPDAEPPAKCFRPRHALVARTKNQTLELVICFECRQYKQYGQKYTAYEPISRSAESLLTKCLADAGVSLAP